MNAEVETRCLLISSVDEIRRHEFQGLRIVGTRSCSADPLFQERGQKQAGKDAGEQTSEQQRCPTQTSSKTLGWREKQM